MDTSHKPIEIRVMPGRAGTNSPYSDQRTIFIEEGTSGKGSGIYTYANGMRIPDGTPKKIRKLFGHIHEQRP